MAGWVTLLGTLSQLLASKQLKILHLKTTEQQCLSRLTALLLCSTIRLVTMQEAPAESTLTKSTYYQCGCPEVQCI